MAAGMWLPAFLQGVRDLVETVAPKGDAQVSVRPGPDGRPGAAYKGAGWYFGVYWAGASGVWGESVEALNLNMGCGVDITRVQPKVPPSKLGEWFMQPGDLHSMVAQVVEVLTEQNWQVADACNNALSRMLAGDRDAVFYEHFDSVRVGAVMNEPPDWILGTDAPKNSPVYVVKASFTGLKLNKLDSELRKP